MEMPRELPSPGGSNHGLVCADVVDDLAAYVWGALEPEARARVDGHRLQCAACDRWLLESSHLLSTLEKATPKIAPPAELRGRVLASIDAMPQPGVSPSDWAATERSVAPTPSPTHDAARESRWPVPGTSQDRPHGPAKRGAARATPDGQLPSGHRRGRSLVGLGHWSRRWRANPFVAGVTTGVVGAVAGALFMVVLVVRPAALNWLSPGQSAFDSSEPGPPGLPQAPRFLPGGSTSPTSRLLELRSRSTAAHGLLMFDTDTRRGALLVEGLEEFAANDYAVWLLQGSQRVQVGSLTVDARGVGMFVLPDPLPVDRPDRIELAPSDRGAPGAAAGVVLSADF